MMIVSKTDLLLILFTAYLVHCKDSPKGPNFIEEPKDAFVVLTKTAKLSCKVMNALNAWFQCNSGKEGSMQSQQIEHSYVDPQTGIRIIELQLEVTRNDLEMHSKRLSSMIKSGLDVSSNRIYRCRCAAYGDHQKVLSSEASVQIGYSPEAPSFVEEPKDAFVVGLKTAKLTCKVMNALNAWFQCNSGKEGSMQSQQIEYSYDITQTGIRIIELQLEVSRNDLETHSKRINSMIKSGLDASANRVYRCRCAAYGEHQKVFSRDASVQIGYTNLYERKIEQSNTMPSAASDNSQRELFLFCFVIIAISLLLFGVFTFFIIIKQRTFKSNLEPEEEMTVADTTGSATLFHLFQQQQSTLQQQQQSPLQTNARPDIIRNGGAVVGVAGGGGGEKMQLITRINSYNGNILEHLVVHNEHILPNISNNNNLETNFLNSNNININNNCTSKSSSVSSNTVMSTPKSTTTTGTSIATATVTSEEENDSEPEYAEPLLTSVNYFNTERKPPLPTTSPPVRNVNADSRRLREMSYRGRT